MAVQWVDWMAVHWAVLLVDCWGGCWAVERAVLWVDWMAVHWADLMAVCLVAVRVGDWVVMRVDWSALTKPQILHMTLQ